MTMAQNVTPKLHGALLVAMDELNDDEIAAQVGTTRRTLTRWKSQPEFAALVDDHRRAWAEALRDQGIAAKAVRIAALDERWRALRRVVEERARDPAMAGVPGGDTGLIVATPVLLRVYKVAGGRLRPTRESRLVMDYRLDVGLLREMRELEKQAAMELGQWIERRDVSGAPVTVIREYEDVPEDWV